MESAPLYGNRKWCGLAIVFGTGLVVAYCLAPGGTKPESHLVAGLSGLIGVYQPRFSKDTFGLLAGGYLRIIVWLFPALALLVWGSAGVLDETKCQAFTGWASRRRKVLLVAMAGLAFVMTLLISVLVLDCHPITYGDEYSYLFHARLFASGRFHADPPPVPEAFPNRAFVCTDRWYGIGFGGHPLLLTVGVLLGSVYLVPAVLSGAIVLLTYVFVKEVFDTDCALLAALFCVLSPLFLFYQATLLPESTSLFFVMSFLVCIAKARKYSRPAWLVAAALCLAYALFTRPQAAVFLITPFALWGIFRGGMDRRSRIFTAVVLSMGVGLGACALFGYAHAVSGEPLGTAVSPGYHRDGLGGSGALGLWEGDYTLARRVANLCVTVVRANFGLLGWPISWLPLLLWMCHRGKTRWDILLVVSAGSVAAFFFVYPVRQEQYFHETFHILCILGAVGVVRAYRAVHAERRWRCYRPRLIGAAVASTLIGFVSVWPLQAEYFRSRASHERETWSFIKGAGIQRGLVFLVGDLGDLRNVVGGNSPKLDDDILLAWVPTEGDVDRVARHFSGRPVYTLARRNRDGAMECKPR